MYVKKLLLALPLLVLTGPAFSATDLTSQSVPSAAAVNFNLPSAAHAKTSDQSTLAATATTAQHVDINGITGAAQCSAGQAYTNLNGVWQCTSNIATAGQAATLHDNSTGQNDDAGFIRNNGVFSQSSNTSGTATNADNLLGTITGNQVQGGTVNVANVVASGNVSGANLSASGGISGNTVIANGITSNGNIQAAGTLGGGGVAVSGAITANSVTANGITSNGNIQAAGTLGGGGVAVSGAITANTVTANGITSFGNIAAGSGISANAITANAIASNGSITAAGLVSAAGGVSTNQINSYSTGSIQANGTIIGNLNGNASTADHAASASGVVQTGQNAIVNGHIDNQPCGNNGHYVFTGLGSLGGTLDFTCVTN